MMVYWHSWSSVASTFLELIFSLWQVTLKLFWCKRVPKVNMKTHFLTPTKANTKNRNKFGKNENVKVSIRLSESCFRFPHFSRTISILPIRIWVWEICIVISNSCPVGETLSKNLKFAIPRDQRTVSHTLRELKPIFNNTYVLNAISKAWFLHRSAREIL